MKPDLRSEPDSNLGATRMRRPRPPRPASWLRAWRGRRSYFHPSILALLCPVMMGLDYGYIPSHRPDIIVTTSPQTVTVAIGSDGRTVSGEVQLTLDGASLGSGNAATGTFAYAVPLTPGTHRLGGTTRRIVGGAVVVGQIPEQLIHYRPDLTPRGRQEVRLNFWPIADTRLREIATGTLSRPLSSAELERFVAGVKAKVREFFNQAYAPFDVVLVDQATAAGGGVVTVDFEDVDELLDVLGTTIARPTANLWNAVFAIPDYNNYRKTQAARVMVGTFKRIMLQNDAFLSATGASGTDSLEQRIRDVGVALGRTAVHEVGHTLGLVAQDDLVRELAGRYEVNPDWAVWYASLFLGIPYPLPDLGGCAEGHNCRPTDTPLSNRDGDGYEIMDAGGTYPYHATFGFADAHTRTERLARFNDFNASYIWAIHPKR